MKWLNYTRMSLWEAGTRRAHELFMGVYHSHSIQIARLIERAHSFARPPSPPPSPLAILLFLTLTSGESVSSDSFERSRRATNAGEERPRSTSVPISASTNEFSHRISSLVFPRKQIAGPDRPWYRQWEDDILRAQFAPARGSSRCSRSGTFVGEKSRDSRVVPAPCHV